MAYQGNPPYQGGPGGPYQGGPGDPGGPYQGGPGGPYQGGPGGPYQGAPGGPYQGAPGGPYQGGPYQGGPYQGAPGYAGVPASQYSDWIHRVGAGLIDYFSYAAIVFIGAITGSNTIYYLFLLVAIGYWIYNRFYLGGQGQSLGKRALGLRLLSEQTGQPIGMLNAFLRDICHFVDGIICFVGYLFPLWDAKRQTLADKIMHTVVVPA